MKQENDTLLLSEQLLEERYIEMMKTRQVLHDMKNHFLLLQNMNRNNSGRSCMTIWKQSVKSCLKIQPECGVEIQSLI